MKKRNKGFKKDAGVAAALAIAHAVTVPVGDAGGTEVIENLDSLLDGVKSDEVVETVAPGEAEIEAAVRDAEATEAVAKAYAEEPAEVEPAKPADAPTAVEGEVKPAKAKKAVTPRKHYSKIGDRISDRLGEKLPEFATLTVEAAAGDPAENAKATLEIVNKLAKKVGEKAAMLFDFLHKGGELNEVMAITFRTLAKDGALTSGDKGNLQVALLAKPYSIGTSRSQANQMFMLLPALQITVKEKGKMVANPSSTLLPAINKALGIGS